MRVCFVLRVASIALVALSIVDTARGESGDKLGADAFAILNRACFECHGRDRQDGGLRLDTREAMLRGGDSGEAVVLDKLAESDLLRRIKLPKSDSEVMPKRGDVLSKSDVAKLERWLKAGAIWSKDAEKQTHWSYVAPKKAELPTIKGETLSNPIDRFVVKRLNEEGIRLSPAADPAVLARRLYLDIVGLPPKVSEVDAFVKEAEQDVDSAVLRLVDRLLDSPQYGDKWARAWLDAARYADSHGFQRDDLHEVWAYRDWVIRALNEDMPFDRFTIEQLAGDLIPNATESQKIATGFNRCAPCNVEAGTDPEENRFNQVVDRVNTLGYAWLGSSLECAQCHDHKYDPFTQRDYYGLFAFFNQMEIEAERANPKVPGSIKFIGPYMSITDPDGDDKAKKLDAEIAAAKTRLENYQNRMAKTGSDAKGVSNRVTLQPIDFESVNGAGHEVLEDGSILLHEDAPDIDTYIVDVAVPDNVKLNGLLVEALTHPSLPGTGPGRGDAKRPNFVINSIEVRPLDSTGQPLSTKLNLIDGIADFSQTNFSPAKAVDDDEKTGWAINPEFAKDHWVAYRIEDAEGIEGVTRLQFKIVQNFGGARTVGRLKLSALTGEFKASLPNAAVEDVRLIKLRSALEALQSKRGAKEQIKTLVAREVNDMRASTMFSRGDFRSPGDAIKPGTPKVLHALPIDAPKNRLGLAKWLVAPENPLVGRVIVNRMWSEIFGIGLVSTPEDFGLKGELPSHPELLDWMATDFVEQGWSQKKLLKLIVTSRTYRQASRISAEQLENDPNNVLLARGPRFRLPAELIRDNALSIAGLLSLKQFGPPIRPPQPEGLWKKVGGQAYDYETSPGEDKYRRGVYVVLKRMSPYPSFVTFDATARLACRVKRSRSNTPLQALTLLNDPVYVEAAQAFASRVQSESVGTIEEQLRYAFRLAVSRMPSDSELATIKQLFDLELAAGGESPEKAAWYAVASALLNLDETITKE